MLKVYKARTMKHLIIFAVIFCCVNADHLKFPPKHPRIFEAEINATLNDFAQSLAENDPLSIPEVNFEINNDNVSVKFSAQDIVVIGHSKFVATKIQVDIFPPSMILNLMFTKPHIIVSTYDLNMKVLFVPFYGKGSINFAPKNIEMGVKATIGIGANGITVSEARPTFNLTESLLHITGVLNNEPLSTIISSSTTECFPIFIGTYGERFSDILGPIVASVLNELLANLIFKDHFIPKPGTIKTHTFEQGDLRGSLRVRF